MRAAFASSPAVVGPSIAELQAAFPQLEILECIGRGGMGIVYKARQPHLDRLVALKILAPGLADDPGFAERFTREARTLAKLTHPNLVAVHDFGESGGYYYLLMEYVDGVNLRQAMQAARFTPEQALGIIPDLCGALQFAHDHGVLHRDIKPENILLDAKGRVKIADFGIARLLGEDPRDVTLTLTGAALGSAAYMAPEQIEHPEDVDHRADIYSLGVVFYEMLTGGLPLGRFPAPSEKSASDPRLDEVVFRALEKERERRYQSAAEVRTGVEGHTTARRLQPPLNTASATGLPTLPAYVKWPVILILAGLLVGGLVLLVAPAGLIQLWVTKILTPIHNDLELTGTSLLLQLGLIISLVSTLIGQLWGIWNLNHMRQGKLPLARRRWLRGFAFWPLLTVVALHTFNRLATWVSWMTGRGGSVDSDVRPWIVLLAFVLVYATTRTLSGLTDLRPTRPRVRWRQAIMPVTAFFLLLGAEWMTKQLSGPWYKHSFGPVDLSIPVGPVKGDREWVKQQVEKAAVTAAGNYLDKIQPVFDGHVLKARLISDPAILELASFPASEPKYVRSSYTLASAYEQRFRASLPAVIRRELGPADVGNEEYYRLASAAQGKHVVIVAMTVLAAFLAGRCGFRVGLISIGGGLVAACILFVLPSPPLPPELVARMISGPQLQPIDPPEYDYSTPRSTIESVIKAASKGDLPAFNRGFSSECNAFVARAETGVTGLGNLEKMKAKTLTITASKQSSETHATVTVKGTDGSASTASSAPHDFRMILEDGDWKIDLGND